MGECAEEQLHNEILGRRKKPRNKRFQRGSGNYMWRTATGLVIPMEAMTPEHRVNAMRICEEMGNVTKLQQLREVHEKIAKLGE